VVFDNRTPDEHQMHVNMYWSSVDQAPYMIVHHGGLKTKPPYDDTGAPRTDQLERLGPTMATAGGAIAFSRWSDGRGYDMECFWPWSYCRTSGKPLAVGEQFTFGIEGLWGNHDGTSSSHRLADGIKDESVNRIFMFRARNGWGRAVISPTGGSKISDEQRADLLPARGQVRRHHRHRRRQGPACAQPLRPVPARCRRGDRSLGRGR
jgi:hypothetical protein